MVSVKGVDLALGFTADTAPLGAGGAYVVCLKRDTQQSFVTIRTA